MKLGNLDLKKNLMAVLVVPVVLVIALSGLAVTSLRDLLTVVDKVDHTHKHLEWALDMHGSAWQMKAAVDGFVITGNEEFLQTYKLGENDALDAAEQIIKHSQTESEAKLIEEARAMILQWKQNFAEPAIEKRRQVNSRIAAEQGAKAVDAGVEQSVLAGEYIQTLTDSVSTSAQAASVIDASSEQQVVGMAHVAAAMMNIDDAMRQKLNLTSQLEDAVREIKVLGASLRELVEKFDA